MRPSYFKLAATAITIVGCGSRLPPNLGDNDASNGNDVEIAPCTQAAPGCPCPEAGVQESCGTVYHYSGSYVTCAEEYMTCQDDSTWGSCVGPQVFNAD